MRSAGLFIASALVFVFAVAAGGSVPHQINYQAYLTDAGGDPITGTLEMTFSIWDAETGGTQLWSETQASVSVVNGTCTVILGSVTSISDNVFTGPSRWLETHIGAEVLSPRREMVSLGYAFRAEHADTAEYALNPDGHSLDAADGDPVDAVLVDNDGDVGIGTTSPSARLDVRGTMQVGTDGAGHDVNLYGADSGSRLFWDASKYAFRAGRAQGSQWDDANVGLYSTAMGRNTMASDLHSTAMGSGTTASGQFSTSMGQGTTASGHWSTAMGDDTEAGGANSTAMGSGTTASGYYSTAMGYRTTAASHMSVVLGRYNVGGGDPTSWSSGDPLFEIGIGADVANKANALTVLKNGSVGIGTASPRAGLHLKGTGYPGSFMYLQSDADEDAGLRLYEDSVEKWHLFNDSALDGLSLRNNAYSSILFVEQSTGHVGIGTTNPNAELEVNGDLVVDGAYRGNIGPNNGAPFPRPAYDSGWRFLSPGSSNTFTHGLGGDVDNYVVDVQFRSSTGIHHIYYGGAKWVSITPPAGESFGAQWSHLTTSSIRITRLSGDGECREGRVRIWVYN